MSKIELDKTSYYIFRGRDSGVFAGNLLERKGQEDFGIGKGLVL